MSCFRPHQGIILFNYKILTQRNVTRLNTCFRPHQGIILFNPVFETTDIY